MAITCRVYPYNANAPVWPESTLWSGYANRTNVGVAFSGGGTRAASLTLGALRALSDARLIDRVRYVSAASGGAWCALPWTFLPRNIDERAWFGARVRPEQLTPALLDRPEHNAFIFRTSDAPLGTLYAQYAQLGDERFGRVIGHVFLRPDGLDDPTRLFTLDAANAARLAPANPDVAFTRVQRDRPFLIVGGAMLLDDPTTDLDWLPFDMTPLYVGVAESHVRFSDRRRFGGGFIDACGFDSAHRTGSGAIRRCEVGSYRFTLNDVMGTTGAAPAAIGGALGLPPSFTGLPRFHTWYVPGSDANPRERSDELRCGDGGLYEHCGVVSLLSRGVRRVIAFINTSEPAERCLDIARLFGAFLPRDFTNPAQAGMQVFPTQEWRSVVDELRQDGVALREHPLVGCPHAGFRPAAGERATVLWVINPSRAVLRTSGWYQRLPADTRTLLEPGLQQRSALAAFPQIPTFLPQPGVTGPDGLIELSYAQSRLLSAWQDWRVASPESEGGILESVCALIGASVPATAAALAASRP